MRSMLASVNKNIRSIEEISCYIYNKSFRVAARDGKRVIGHCSSANDTWYIPPKDGVVIIKNKAREGMDGRKIYRVH